MPHGDSRVVIHGYIHTLFNRYVSTTTAIAKLPYAEGHGKRVNRKSASRSSFLKSLSKLRGSRGPPISLVKIR